MRSGFTPLQRAQWVAALLEEYLSRLVGALSLPGWSLASLKGSDTIGIVDIGVEVLHTELQKTEAPPHVTVDWNTFRKTGRRSRRTVLSAVRSNCANVSVPCKQPLPFSVDR